MVGGYVHEEKEKSFLLIFQKEICDENKFPGEKIQS